MASHISQRRNRYSPIRPVVCILTSDSNIATTMMPLSHFIRTYIQVAFILFPPPFLHSHTASTAVI